MEEKSWKKKICDICEICEKQNYITKKSDAPSEHLPANFSYTTFSKSSTAKLQHFSFTQQKPPKENPNPPIPPIPPIPPHSNLRNLRICLIRPIGLIGPI